ncbi:GNAT family N-acetyltransferase [Parasphingorhabdus pacifica]
MSEHDVRPLAEDEFEEASRLFLASLHVAQPSAARWLRSKERYEPGRVFGVFGNDEMWGTALSMTGSLVVPGGGSVAAAAVTGVGVRADRTRRGVLTDLMRAQLTDVRDRGEPVAMLHASETVIYPRFGYGPASRSRKVSLRQSDTVFRADAPGAGSVRLVDTATAEKLLPEVYGRISSTRPGMITRSDAWWATRLALLPENGLVAVHSDDDGVEDGFALYDTEKRDHQFDTGGCVLKISDIQGADTSATASLWRFLLGIDLVTEVAAVDRPLDEPLEWWLVDRRTCRVTDVSDDLWIRLVDVASALNARTFNEADPVVLEVRDRFLPENSGNYRVAPGGVVRCEQSAQLGIDVDLLGSLYLGDVAVSTLAASKRIDVYDRDAVREADRLFRTDEVPWCGTGF